MWCIILYYFLILKYLVTSASLRFRPVIAISDVHKPHVNMMRNDQTGMQPSPEPFQYQPSRKPLCDSIPVPGISCEEPTTCVVTDIYLDDGILHRNQVICNTIRQWSAQINHPATPPIQMLRQPPIPVEMPAKYRNEPPQITTNQIQNQRYDIISFREKSSPRFTTPDSKPDLRYDRSRPPPLGRQTSSTRPPYPGGIKPDTEEISGDYVICDGDAICHKYAWTSTTTKSTVSTTRRFRK